MEQGTITENHPASMNIKNLAMCQIMCDNIDHHLTQKSGHENHYVK